MSTPDKTVRPIPLRQPAPCPICQKKSTNAYHPFCSAHCANVDLNRWLTGQYAIPSNEEPGDNEPQAD